MIMEIADGGDMQDLFKRNKLENRWLVESQIWMYVEQIIRGIKCIHDKNIVHRDIKGLNIFLTKKKQVKIGDFGISKFCEKNKMLMTKLGTPLYLSPELVRNEKYNNNIIIL
jgi:serine/threonine protein kinase